MKNSERLRIRESELRSVLLPRLMGQAFHVTTKRAYARICRDGSIKSNQDGKLRSEYPQSAVSYFRKRGYVCIFDLRTATAEHVNDALLKFFFLNPFHRANPVFLVLGDAAYEQLIPWSVSIPDEGCRAMVIPYVEAGYPRAVPLALVDSVLVVDVRREVPPWRAKLEAGIKMQRSSQPERSVKA